MNPLDVAQTYFDAWNQRDPAAIIATFAEGGTYSDPTVPALTGSALATHAGGLFAAFPTSRLRSSALPRRATTPSQRNG